MSRSVPALLALLSLGCGSVIKDTAVMAATTGAVMSQARRIIVETRRTELDHCTDVACLDAVERRWEVPLAAYEGVRTAHALLVDALVVADVADGSEVSLEALRAALVALASAADDLARCLVFAGVDLPPELNEAIQLITHLMRAVGAQP